MSYLEDNAEYYEERTRIADEFIPEHRAMTRYRYIYGGEDDVLLEFMTSKTEH